ncbi:uncharacterized protein EKO05_0006238 [Ascochyta rabiei]|uniref:uncharacterized protein n=1 Tax=Didymella rabiei TaxID=5454 RepID=UPI0022018CFD|nr:uncharacterized protein EKO05_0006238 [Ascochyta rabiei]UPX15799.1 hypothetical protein EKO05_0006238 [Ascochyta rabiei]
MQPYIPDPGAPAYRDQVASSIQGLVSGQRPRNQAMSGVGTGRLMLEGVVESLRIYREWKEKEEKKRTEGSGDGERKRRGTGRGGKKDRGHSHRSRRHGEEKRSVEGSEERHGHRRRRRRREARAGRDADREGRECHHQEESQRTQSPQPTLSSALNTEEQLLGPDGTPFGSLPVKGKGVGIAAHARTVYRHVKAEQEAGRRSKGLAEKHLGAFWKKRRSVERDGDEEPLVRKGGRRDQRSSVSRDREGGRRSRRDGGGVYERERDGGQVADASARSAKPGRPPTPFAQGSSLPVRPSRQGSRHCRQDSMDPGDGLEGGESSRSAGQAPTIHVQSPAPPEPTKSVRSATPFTTPTPSNAPPPPPISTAPFMVATPYNLTPSVADVPVPVVPATPSAPLPSRRPRRPPRPPPTPPAPPTGDAARGALMAGFLGGAPNLRKVDPNRKKHSNMFSAGRVIAGSDSEGRPVYEGTPHSDEVEAREHAEAVEERERKEEEIFRSKVSSV